VQHRGRAALQRRVEAEIDEQGFSPAELLLAVRQMLSFRTRSLSEESACRRGKGHPERCRSKSLGIRCALCPQRG